MSWGESIASTLAQARKERKTKQKKTHLQLTPLIKHTMAPYKRIATYRDEEHLFRRDIPGPAIGGIVIGVLIVLFWTTFLCLCCFGAHRFTRYSRSRGARRPVPQYGPGYTYKTGDNEPLNRSASPESINLAEPGHTYAGHAHYSQHSHLDASHPGHFHGSDSATRNHGGEKGGSDGQTTSGTGAASSTY